MDEKEFSRLIKKGRYQVFLFTSPCSFPINMFPHYWFVCNKKGKISRWEVLNRKNKKKKHFGHVYDNFLSPAKGLEIFYFYPGYHWNSKLVLGIEGGENSTASKMIRFLEKAPKNYPYSYKYNLIFGPNSNTFAQWVIDRFPDSGFQLSWTAIGKNYRK